MKLGDKVFVIIKGEVLAAEINYPLSHRGVVTGYYLKTPHCDSPPVKIARKYVFTDEDEAKKALFLMKLKTEEKVKVPVEDAKGDRHWIAGFKKRKW